MLILTRKLGEGIRINDDVVVKVVDIRGNQVRLGIAAPRSVPVHREEVHEMITQQNAMAAETAPADLDGVAVLWQQGRKSE
ncbi:carbon storage regulator CsrA [Candidatus Sumerlaeota bacterium]|nr:carbon storage regulator CsrA [Candidatus Sumerlaeota bacterium]